MCLISSILQILSYYYYSDCKIECNLEYTHGSKANRYITMEIRCQEVPLDVKLFGDALALIHFKQIELKPCWVSN